MESGTGCGRVMAGLFLLPRAARRRPFWPRELRRGALLLGVSAALFWSSFAIGRWIVFFPESGPIYVDLLLGWIAVILHVSAWPNLWVGLRDLRGRQPRDDHPIIAWRSFLMTLVMIVAAVVVLPLEYHSLSATDAWIFVAYVSAFPYLGWTFVPILALHGVLCGRVAWYLESRSRRIADAGAMLLFAVAAATTAVILQNPGRPRSSVRGASGRDCFPRRPLAGMCSSPSGLRLRLRHPSRGSHRGLRAGPGGRPQARARPRSSCRSCGSSSPTEKRTKPSVIPCAWRCSLGTLACVIVAGCSMSDSTPPRLSARMMTSSFRRRSATLAESRSSKLSMPPNPRICFFAVRWPGSSGRPG